MYKLKPLFQDNIDKINWKTLSINKNAIYLLYKLKSIYIPFFNCSSFSVCFLYSIKN